MDKITIARKPGDPKTVRCRLYLFGLLGKKRSFVISGQKGSGLLVVEMKDATTKLEIRGGIQAPHGANKYWGYVESYLDRRMVVFSSRLERAIHKTCRHLGRRILRERKKDEREKKRVDVRSVHIQEMDDWMY